MSIWNEVKIELIGDDFGLDIKEALIKSSVRKGNFKHKSQIDLEVRTWTCKKEDGSRTFHGFIFIVRKEKENFFVKVFSVELSDRKKLYSKARIIVRDNF